MLVLAALALAAGGCAETDLGLEAKQDVKRIDQDVQRQAEQIKQGIGQPAPE